MLTDKDLSELIITYMDEYSQELYDLARVVERAVLAKAGERAPLRYVLIGSDGEVVGKLFQAKIQAENYAESMLVGNFTATAIYAHPLPAQAIPEYDMHLAFIEGWELGWVERHSSIDNDQRVQPWAIPKAKQNADWLESQARAMLSTSPKP